MGGAGISICDEGALARAASVLAYWARRTRWSAEADFDDLIGALEIGELAVRWEACGVRVIGGRQGLVELARAGVAAEGMFSRSDDVSGHRVLELRMGLALAGIGYSVELAEPDVVATRSGMCALVACKVVQGGPGSLRAAALRDHVAKGLHQIRRQLRERVNLPGRQRAGIVLVSLRNHVRHGEFMPQVAQEEVRNLSEEDVMRALERDTGDVRQVLDETGASGVSLQAHIDEQLLDFTVETRCPATVAFYQGSTFVSQETRLLSPFRRVWTRWQPPAIVTLLQALHDAIQFPTT